MWEHQQNDQLAVVLDWAFKLMSIVCRAILL